MKPLDRIYQQAVSLTLPLAVHFDLTYRCHQRCLHCYLPEAWRAGSGGPAELDTDQVKGILEQLAAAGTFLLTFSGGEIFLRPDLLELLTYARRLNFSITLLTSGTWGLEAEQCRELNKIGLEAIHVSLYSLIARIHDAITQTPGSWARLQRSLDYCRAANLRVGFNCLVCNLNFRELPALKDFADRRGSLIRFDSGLSMKWDGRPHPPGLALNPENRAYLDQHWLAGESDEPLGVAPELQGGCKAGIISCYIGADGEVWPCVDLPWPCGSLRHGEPFERLWRHSATLNRVRRLQQSLSPADQTLCQPYQQGHSRSTH